MRRMILNLPVTAKNLAAKAIFLLCVWGFLIGCEGLGGGGADAGSGELRLMFLESGWQSTRASGVDIPDTNDFILKVADASGKEIFNDYYGKAPEVMTVSAGSYDISVRSGTFAKPAFSAPIFGDDKCVTVPSGGSISVHLECSQVNSGVRLVIAPAFLTEYPNASLLLKSSDGSLLYSYSEKRTAYFNPGAVSLVMSEGAVDKTLCTRYLSKNEMLTLGVQVAVNSGSSSDPGSSSDSGSDGPTGAITISVDTARVWTSDEYVIGGDGNGGNTGADPDNAVSVAQAKTMAGQNGIWVKGYIVGGDLTSTAIYYDPPFGKNTHLAIADKAVVTLRESCMAVELPKGTIRDALNLVDHPDYLGKQVWFYGNIVDSYFSLYGLKSVSDYVLK